MLRPRIIPCLLIRNKGLVKTTRFTNDKYVGDPLNAVRIFNEKEVDEIIISDIDATSNNVEPNYQLIRNVATECRMPLCYAGGIKHPDQVEKIIGLGVEKVAISSAAIDSLDVISQSAKRVGNQSIVVVMDVKKKGLFRNKYELFTVNGKISTGIDPITFSKNAESAGAGEVLVNSIDRDGEMKGYDFELIDQVRNAISIPLSVQGGAGSMNDIAELIKRYGVIGAVAGSLFVFKGKYRAVLINYPSCAEKDALFALGPLHETNSSKS